jgi:hypothetical protein
MKHMKLLELRDQAMTFTDCGRAAKFHHVGDGRTLIQSVNLNQTD